MMPDIFQLAFLPVDTVPDMQVFDAEGASLHRSLVEAVQQAVRGCDGNLVPFIHSRGVVFNPHNIQALATELNENRTQQRGFPHHAPATPVEG